METTNFDDMSMNELEAQLRAAQKENTALKREKNRVGLSFRRVPETGSQIKALWDERFPYLEHVPENSYTLADRHVDDEAAGRTLSMPAVGNTTLIEAENLAGLSALQLTHAGAVDLIYIDPPYNTGNKDFVYNDARTSSMDDVLDEDGNKLTVDDYERTLDGNVRSVGKDDPERHSLWLSFMEKRLWLAKHLLSESGVIFVSIDDNEQARLKLLMDEVFGEENFIANMVYDGGLKNNSRFISSGHDYILIYARNQQSLIEHDIRWRESKRGIDLFLEFITTELAQIPRDKKQFVLRKWIKENEDYVDKGLRAYRFVDEEGNVYTSDNLASPTRSKNRYTVLHPVTGKPVKLPAPGWRITEQVFRELQQQGKILFGKDETTVPRYKRVLGANENIDQVARSYFWQDRSIATAELQDILGPDEFQFPKHVSVIKRLIKLAASPDAVILDFFAGSGTTAHAVAELNAEDGGNRSCILITHGDENGKNIAEDVTAERMKRVLSGENWADGKEHDPLPGELNYYRLQFAGKPRSKFEAAEILQDKFIGYAALEQNVVLDKQQPELDNVHLLTSPTKQVIVVSDDFMLLDEELDNYIDEVYNVELENIVYIPLADDTDVVEYSYGDGWKVISFPDRYLESHNSLIHLMKSNKTLLQPVISETIEENVDSVSNAGVDNDSSDSMSSVDVNVIESE